MYFYYVLAIIVGLLFLANASLFIFKPKMYHNRYDYRHFKKSQKTFDVLNMLSSLILGLIILVLGIIACIPSIKFDNHDMVFCMSFCIIIAVALIITILLEKLFMEPVKK